MTTILISAYLLIGFLTVLHTWSYAETGGNLNVTEKYVFPVAAGITWPVFWVAWFMVAVESCT